MNTTTSRRGKHIAAVGAAAAGLLFWGLSELAVSPAHADPITDTLNNVDVVFSAGEQFLTLGDQYLAAGEPTYALDAYLTGVDNTLFAPLENLYVDGIDALTNTPVASPFDIDAISPAPADFATALTDAQAYYDIAQVDFTQATNLMTVGDFPAAELLEVAGNNALWFEAPNALILGLTESVFGF
ncbi:hypothetical protein A5658_23480 [Mycobacterium sp. 1245111.1]|uniref:hypothetical protein n=1 Tax=Mycobacterium sp. 1245111.1 TaxID=1834073 RepID=UPI0007FDBEBE|nr:hypothetical protein [Mycobacterium sp. 1245111.1]OBK40081.1 hypothetical protein A5658_23480 [Mycobacterium sp. 1245111.1]